jgi:hypothetical protein
MMVDPGRPFARSFQAQIEALEQRVRDGVEQPATFEAIFNGSTTSYELPANLEAVTRVSGLVGAHFVVFTRGVDYRHEGGRLVWLKLLDAAAGGQVPQVGSRFSVEYTFRDRPAGLTDFNPGSVISTLLRAFARELTLLYDQVDEAYRRAFIDQAEGVALDNVVALVGVTRNPALAAKGEVTFFARRAPRVPVQIPAGTRVTDESGRAFRTSVAAGIPRVSDPATAPVETGVPMSAAGVAQVRERVDTVVAVWDQRDNEPTPANRYAVAVADPPFGDDERSITISPRGAEALPTVVRVRYVPKSVTVAVQAEQPGEDGNAGPRTIVVMPTPPAGVAGVVNERVLGGGRAPEPDAQLRQRAKFALERAGNATLNAIRNAVLDIDNIEAVEVIDHAVDESIPLGEVYVRYSGADAAEVRRVVENTRAAGVLVRLKTFDTVTVSGTVYAIPDGPPQQGAATALRNAIIDAVGALASGQPLSLRRLAALSYAVPGLADVAEIQFEARHVPSGGEPGPPAPVAVDPFTVDRTEIIKLSAAAFEVRLLAALAVAGDARAVDARRFEIDLELLDTTGAAVRFASLALDVNVTLRATPVSGSPDDRVRIGGFTRSIAFAASPRATLTIEPTDLENFNPLLHAPTVDVVITPAAYPGLNVEHAQIQLTIA